MAITYKSHPKGHIEVCLDGKHVGDIKACDWNVLRNPVRWHYKPKGSKAGDAMESIEAVKRSLGS